MMHLIHLSMEISTGTIIGYNRSNKKKYVINNIKNYLSNNSGFYKLMSNIKNNKFNSNRSCDKF